MNIALFQLSACDLGFLPLFLASLIPLLIGVLIGWLIWAKWRKRYDDMVSKYDKLTAEFNRVSAERDEWQTKHEDVSSQLRRANNDVSRLGNEVQEHKGTIESHRTEISQFKIDADNAQASIASLTAGASKHKQELEAVNSRYSEEKSKLTNDLAAASASLVALKNDTTHADELNRVKNKNSELEAIIAELKSSAANKDAKLSEMSSSLAAAGTEGNQELIDVKNRNSNLEDELAALKSMLSEKDNKMTELTAKLAVATQAAAPIISAPVQKEDLTKVEGIGPKTKELFYNANIYTFRDLANSDVSALQQILVDAGSRFQMLDPGTWPRQARLAADGKWDELNTLQDYLDGGKEPTEKGLTETDLAEAATVFGKKIKLDDLTLVEGIGPKIASLLNEAGVTTWRKLAKTEVPFIAEVLEKNSLGFHVPNTWPKQAEMAADGKWAALLKWQDELDGGK